jgi:hypothetical protein
MMYIVVAAYRASLARAATTVDVVTRGRFTLAVGRGISSPSSPPLARGSAGRASCSMSRSRSWNLSGPVSRST